MLLTTRPTRSMDQQEDDESDGHGTTRIKRPRPGRLDREKSREPDSRASPSGVGVPSSDDLLFPNVLVQMLSDASNEGFEDIVSWGNDLSAFNVHKKREFEAKILPKYFKMTKYKSFTRQLHNYAFKWVRQGPDKGGYCHPCFSRTDPEKSKLLSRRPAQGSSSSSRPLQLGLPPALSRQDFIGMVSLDHQIGGVGKSSISSYISGYQAINDAKRHRAALPQMMSQFYRGGDDSSDHSRVFLRLDEPYQEHNTPVRSKGFLGSEKIPPPQQFLGIGSDDTFEPRTIEEMLEDGDKHVSATKGSFTAAPKHGREQEGREHLVFGKDWPS